MKQKLYLFLFCLIVMSCQEKKQLEEMHHSTIEMNHTTHDLLDETKKMGSKMDGMSDSTKSMDSKMDNMNDGMNKTVDRMENMSGKMDGMSNNTSEMNKEMKGMTRDLGKTVEEIERVSKIADHVVDVSKQAGSLTVRKERLEDLEKATAMQTKLSQASAYIQAFEFEIWSGLGPDTSKEKREHLIFDGLQEFFIDVKAFYNPTKPIDPSAEPEGFFADNKQANFNAIAAAMNKYNRLQDDYAVSNQLPVYTMYTLIKEALTANFERSKGRDVLVPSFLAPVIINKEIAIRLLQARHNFLLALIVSDLSKISYSFITKIKMLLTPWHVDLNSFEKERLENLIKWADGSKNTRQLLLSIGEDLEFNSKLKSVCRNMKINSIVEGKPNSDLAEKLAVSLEELKSF